MIDEELFYKDDKQEQPEAVDGYWCDNCWTFIQANEYDEQPSYECASCGEQFLQENSYSGDNHQCPSCMKFASKLVDIACPNCITNELRECQAREIDGEWFEVE